MGQAAEEVSFRDSSQDPISTGARRGMDASRQSYGMSEAQRQQALGEALMAFFGTMGSSKNPSALGSMNEGFMPALQQFKSARAEAQGLNKAEMDALREEERHREKMEFEYAREKRLANAPGKGTTLSPSGQFQVINSINTAKINYEKAKNEIANDIFNQLDPNEKTPQNYQIALAAAENHPSLQPYKEQLQYAGMFAEAYGIPNPNSMQNPAIANAQSQDSARSTDDLVQEYMSLGG